MDQETTEKALTFGEKAAGVTFNPSRDPMVDLVKLQFAVVIDQLHKLRSETKVGSRVRYYSKAISYAEDAQMNAVKAITWAHED